MMDRAVAVADLQPIGGNDGRRDIGLALRDGGMKLKDAVRRVSDDTGLPRNALYDAALKA